MLPSHLPTIDVGFFIRVNARIHVVVSRTVSSRHTRDGLGRHVDTFLVGEACEDELPNRCVGCSDTEFINRRLIKRTQCGVSQIGEQHNVFLLARCDEVFD